MTKKQNRLSYFGIVLLCFFLYGNSLNNDYSVDDEYVINGNPLVEMGIRGIPKIFKSHYVNKEIEQHGYRPVAIASFAIEYQFFEATPKVSHFINLLIYALTCIVLFRLLKRLFREYHWALALLTTLLFLVLPIHSEVVNNVKCRDELLSFLFAISSLFQFVKYADKKRFVSIALGIFFMILAVFSKLSAITFMALIPLTLWFFTDVKLKRVLFILGGMFAGFLILRFGILNMLEANVVGDREGLFHENPLYLSEGGILGRIPMAFYTILYYLKLLVFPKTLLFYYGYNHVSIIGWGNPLFFVSLIVVLPILIYGLIKIKTKSPLIYGILFFFLAISMFSNFIIPAVGIIAERFAYSASLGFSIAMAALILMIFKATLKDPKKLNLKYKGAFFGVMAVVLIASTARVVTRTKDWKDRFSLLKHDIQNAPNSAKLNALLANSLFVEMRNTRNPQARLRLANEALPYYEKSVELVPEYETSWNNMATLYFNELRDFENAKRCYEKAIDLKPDYVTALFGLGYCYEIEKNYDKAMEYYNRVLELEPDQPRALEHIEAVKASMGV